MASTTTQDYILGVLTILILLSGITYVTFKNDLRIRVDEDKSTFYTKNDNNRWVTAGREYGKLRQGTSNLNRRVAGVYLTTIVDESASTVTIRRHTPYIRGPVVVDTWHFDGGLTTPESFPVYHTVEIFNATGMSYIYEVKDLEYHGDTFKLDGQQRYMNFGKDMKVVWWPGYRLGWVYQQGSMYVKSEKITEDYVMFKVRLFDPTYTLTLNGTAASITAELGSVVQVRANTSNTSDLVCIDVNHHLYGNNYTCGTENITFNLNINNFRNNELEYSSSNQTAFNITSTGTGWCYQESTNTSTSCGGLDTGSYLCTGDWENLNFPCVEAFNEIWNTANDGAHYAQPSNEGILYINYTKPSTSVNTSLWQVEYCIGGGFNGTHNLTINQSCWDYGNTLMLRFNSSYPGGGIAYGTCECYNGSEWIIMVQHSGGTTAYACLSEEAMYWYVTGKNNKTTYLYAHQYDEVDGLSLNLTGFTQEGTYANDVRIYINDSFSNFIGDVFENQITKFSDDTTAKNVTFDTGETKLVEHFKMFDGTTVTSAFMNFTGYNHTYEQETADDNILCDGSFYNPCSNAYDGSYSTYATPDVGNTTTIYFNYTKPTDVMNQSVWQVKDHNATVNLSLSNSCWGPDILQLKVEMESDSGAVFEAFTSTANSDIDNWTTSSSYWTIANVNVEDEGFPGYPILRGRRVLNDNIIKYDNTFDVSGYANADITVKGRVHNLKSDDTFKFRVDCNNDGTNVYNILQQGAGTTQDAWITGSYDLEARCGYKPTQLAIYYIGDLGTTNAYFYSKDLFINAEPKANTTWSCYDGSSWVNLREIEYSGSNANQYARAYEESVHWIGYTTDPWMEIGDINGTREWNYTAGNFTTTNSPSKDFTIELNNYLSDCDLDDDDFCNVPIHLSSDGIGKILMKDVMIKYSVNINPIILDSNAVQDYLDASTGDTLVKVPIKFESAEKGIIQVNDIRYDYAGGNKTYLVTARDNANTSSKSYNITYYYSAWDYNMPQYIDWEEFIPGTPTSKNVTPYGQTSTRPLYNISMHNYGGKNMNLSFYLNESYSCINITVSTTNSKSAGTQLTSGSWIDLMTDREYLNYTGLWFWADYGCSYTTWKLWEPYWYMRGCCYHCDVCDEGVE